MNIGDHVKAFFSDVGRVFDTKKKPPSERFGESVIMRVAAVGLIAVAAVAAAFAVAAAVASGSALILLPVLVGVGIAVIAGHDLFRVGTNMRQQTTEALVAQGKSDAQKVGKKIKDGDIKKAAKTVGKTLSNLMSGTSKIIEQEIQPSFKTDVKGTLIARHFTFFDPSKG